MLGHRRRRWASIDPPQVQCLVCVGYNMGGESKIGDYDDDMSSVANPINTTATYYHVYLEIQ